MLDFDIFVQIWKMVQAFSACLRVIYNRTRAWMGPFRKEKHFVSKKRHKELKEKLVKTKNKEEVTDILKAAGQDLSDDDKIWNEIAKSREKEE